MKKVIKLVAVILASMTVLACAGSIFMGKYVAEQILYQNKGNDTKGNSIRQLEIWGYNLGNFLENHKGEEFEVTAEDENVVPGTLFKSAICSDKWVVLVHGAGGDRVSTYPLAEEYLKRGYNVIAFDQRGSGDNGDNRVTFGILEAMDVEAVVQYARNELAASTVIVHGQSMGAQTAALYASGVNEDNENVADAVILDSPVPGMERFLRLMFGGGPEGAYAMISNYLIFTSKMYMDVVYHIDVDDGDTISRVKNDNIPTLVIASDKDEVCLPEMVMEVYHNIATDRKAVIHADSAHIEGVIDNPDGYMESVMDFLGQNGLR